MSDAPTQTKEPVKFDADAFAQNITRALESSGQAVATFLKPIEDQVR